MQAGCSLQSELRPAFWDWLQIAPWQDVYKRQALSPAAALAVLKEGAGSTWDPELVSLFKSNLSILQNQNSF